MKRRFFGVLRWRVDILSELRKKGYNQTVLRRDRIMGQKDLSRLRRGEVVGALLLDRICGLLHKQPGALLEWVPDPAPEDPDHSPGGVE